MKFKQIIKNSKPYLIAEVGVNHENNLSIAERIIKQAKIGGANAVKFQTYTAETLAAKKSPYYWDLKKVKLIDTIYCSTNEKKIINHCKTIGLPFEVRDEIYCKDDSNIVDYLYEILKKKNNI